MAWFISIKCLLHFKFRNGLLICIGFNCACFYFICISLQCVYFDLKNTSCCTDVFKKRNRLKNQKVFEIIQLVCKTKLYSYPEKLVTRKNRADVNIVKVESNCLGKRPKSKWEIQVFIWGPASLGCVASWNWEHSDDGQTVRHPKGSTNLLICIYLTENPYSKFIASCWLSCCC